MGFSPQQSVIHVDQHLSNVALDFKPRGFIADQIFPIVNVPNESGSYVIFDQANAFRQKDTSRSRGTAAKMTDYAVSSGGFFVNKYGLADGMTIEDMQNADPIYVQGREEGMARRLTTDLMLDWDIRIANQVTNTSNVGTSSAVSSGWTDYTNSDPLGDIWSLMDNLHDATAYRPNVVVMGELAYRNFVRNFNVINKVNQTGIGGGALPATQDQVARLLEVDKVLVGRGYKNTANQGQAKDLSQIWGDNVLAYYAPDNASIDEPSFGYSFRWTRPGLANMNVKRLPYDEELEISKIEVGYYQDEKITAQSLGGLLTAVTSST